MKHDVTQKQDGHINKTQDVQDCLEIAASRANLQAASCLSCEAQSARLALHEHLYSAVVAANGCPLQVFNGLFQQGPYSAKSAPGPKSLSVDQSECCTLVHYDAHGKL